MKTPPTLCHGLIGAAFTVLAFAAQLSAQPITGTAIPGGCAEAPKRPSEVGCYLSAVQPIEKLPDEPFWHLYTYPTRAAAEAAAKSQPTSTVAESLDKVWVFTIANAQWRRTGLGDEFVAEVSAAFDRVRDAPESYLTETGARDTGFRLSPSAECRAPREVTITPNSGPT